MSFSHPGPHAYHLYPSKSVIDNEKLRQCVKQICRYVEKAAILTFLLAQDEYRQEPHIMIVHHLYRSFKSDSENAYRLAEIRSDPYCTANIPRCFPSVFNQNLNFHCGNIVLSFASSDSVLRSLLKER
jgi:hypothetical protein